MRIARVFPRITRATPRDDLAFFEPPGLFPPEVDAVHVSVTFSWDRGRAQWLARQWEHIAPLSIGGPAMGTVGQQFTPGMYLAPGYVITSRGCPNRCWFCEVWKRDGTVRELEIHDGWNVLDDNLLACSEPHVRSVFEMLKRQKEGIEFTGGFEAARLEDWHVDLLIDLNPQQIFFAYDTPDDYEPLLKAGERLRAASEKLFTLRTHKLRAFVLIGGPNDTPEKALTRLEDTLRAGYMPYAMLWKHKDQDKHPRPSRYDDTEKQFRRLQSMWDSPTYMHGKIKSMRLLGDSNEGICESCGAKFAPSSDQGCIPRKCSFNAQQVIGDLERVAD